MVAGLSFGLAFLSLQLGLMIALLRFRLYDAESAISRSANIALITLGVTAVFAGAADALKQIVYNYTGNNGSEGPVIIAAVLATVLVNPIQERITSVGLKDASRRTCSCFATTCLSGSWRHARDRVAHRNAG